MAQLSFICEHCGKEFIKFLRPSEVDAPVTCPACKQTTAAAGTSDASSTQAASAGKGPVCVRL